ncbi:MFS transporter [Propioniciclava coleopterorum]|uniref:MFS transporter n=1 Tax=Propioniciclava coleopterorum TaxID=2714937 RepID=A0A6G7Y5D5_9ACTN|nr:MFS transporter [Propioniciclava coleopterorum]QIK71993.1 MFS transporter [Propioniciclava coleopterorum]
MTITELSSPTAAKLRWWALAVLMLPVLLVAVDNTVLAFAVPAISEALRPTGVELLWIVDVYPLVLAGLLIPMGSLGDRFGRRRLLLIGATGFAAVSVIAAFAPTASALIALRAAMGFFGAMIMPATLSLIRNIFTDAEERRLAIAIWAAGFSGGAALGPLVGGFLLEHFWWGSVFLLAVPVLLPLLIAGLLVLPESRDPQPGAIDPLSTLLVLAAMSTLVWSIKSVTVYGATPEVMATLAASLVTGVWFVHRQLHRANPMLDVRLFANPTFSGAVSANLLSIFSMVGFLFFVSQHLQLVSGRTPIQAGLVLLPGLVITIVAGLVVVRIARVLRPGTIVVIGLLLNAVGYALVMLSGRAGSDAGLLVAFALLGAGVGFSETISNDLILASVPAAKAGAASAISETAYEVGSVLGTAVLGGLLTAIYRGGVQVPAGLSPEQAAAAGETLGGALDVAAGLPAALAEPLLESARAAFDSGVVVTSGIGIVLMLVAAGLARVTLKNA